MGFPDILAVKRAQRAANEQRVDKLVDCLNREFGDTGVTAEKVPCDKNSMKYVADVRSQGKSLGQLAIVGFPRDGVLYRWTGCVTTVEATVVDGDGEGQIDDGNRGYCPTGFDRIFEAIATEVMR